MLYDVKLQYFKDMEVMEPSGEIDMTIGAEIADSAEEKGATHLLNPFFVAETGDASERKYFFLFQFERRPVLPPLVY